MYHTIALEGTIIYISQFFSSSLVGSMKFIAFVDTDISICFMSSITVAAGKILSLTKVAFTILASSMLVSTVLLLFVAYLIPS